MGVADPADPADELRHDAQPAGATDRTAVRVQLTGDDPQQRGLAHPVGTHQRSRAALPYPERHVREQWSTVGERVLDGDDVQVAHGPEHGRARRWVATGLMCSSGPSGPRELVSAGSAVVAGLASSQ